MFVLKIEVHRVLVFELIKHIVTKITIIIKITDKNYNYSNNWKILVISGYISVYADHAIDK